MSQMKKILFGLRPNWEKGLRHSTDPLRFDITMADLRQVDTAGFDAVVPLGLKDHDWLERKGQGLPALAVPKAMRHLCDDKLALNQRLIDLGFGRNIPALHDRLPDDPGLTPVIVKARKGAWGQDIDLVLAQPKPDQFSARLAAGTHFIQDFVPGRLEYATHVLIRRGVPQMVLTIEYDMGDTPRVKGVLNEPLKSRWLTETPGQDILLAMLKAIGFADGTCCLNYRFIDGQPVLFEINPRFGGSLAWNVSAYLDAYLACVSQEPALPKRNRGRVTPKVPRSSPASAPPAHVSHPDGEKYGQAGSGPTPESRKTGGSASR